MKKKLISAVFVYRILLFLPFLVAFQSDSPVSQYILPVAGYSVSSADIDLDGDQDVLVGHFNGVQGTNPSFSVLANNGGVFSITDTSKSYAGYQWNIFACNIDNDTYPDLVTQYSDFSTGTMKRYLRIWFNINGNFSDFQDYSLNTSAPIDGITYGDVNDDGLIDILVFSSNSHFWGVLYNLGNGFLSLPEYHNEIGNYPSNIACGDLNGDGRDDVIISGQITTVYYSLPTGFQAEVLELNNFKDMLAVVDFDGDGDNDLLTATVVYSLVMYRNLDDTALQALPMVNTLMPSTNIAVVDFNNDNLPDIAFLTMYPDTSGTGITDTIGGINIFYNLGNFQLSAPQFISLTNYDESLRNFHTADFDGNGYNDFAVVRSLTNQTSTLELLFNDGNGNFTGTPVGVADRRGKPGNNGLNCFPNPFHAATTFEIDLDRSAMVELSVFDLRGRFLTCITSREMKPGRHSIPWDGSVHAVEPGSSVLIANLKVNGEIRCAVRLMRY